MTSVQFEIIGGKRINSNVLYIKSEKQLYTKKSEFQTKHLQTKQYFVCYIRSCKSRVTLENGVCLKPLDFVEHNHGDQQQLYEKMKVLNGVKRDCMESESDVGDWHASFASNALSVNPEKTLNDSSSAPKPTYKRTTDQQYSLLTREMAKHNVNNRSGKQSIMWWTELTERLNTLGPPFRNVSQWKKVWTDFRRFHSRRNFQSQPKFQKNIKNEPSVENETIDLEEDEENSHYELPDGNETRDSFDDNEIMNFEQNSLSMHSTFSNDYSDQYNYSDRDSTHHHPDPSELVETLIPDEPSFSGNAYSYAKATQEPPKRPTPSAATSVKTSRPAFTNPQSQHSPNNATNNSNLLDQTLYTLQNQMEHQTKLLEHLSQISGTMASLMERQVIASEKQTEAIRRQASAAEHHTLVMNSFVDMIREKMPKANLKTTATNLANGNL